jgi:hypothetical protein
MAIEKLSPRSCEQGVVDAFCTAGLIPTKVNFTERSCPGFNDLFPTGN